MAAPSISQWSRAITLGACLMACSLSAQHSKEHIRQLEVSVLQHMGPSPDSAMARLERLRQDPDAQADPDHGVRVGYLEAALLDRRGRFPEALVRIQAVDTTACSDPGLKGQVKNFLGRIAYDNDAHELALAAYTDALGLITDTVQMAVILNNLAHVQERLKDFPSALASLERSIMLYEAIGDQARLAGSLLNRGVVLYDLQRHPEAEDHFRRSLALAQALGMPDVEGIAEESLGNVLRETGRAAEALPHYEAALRLAAETQSMEGRASIHGNIGQLHLGTGAPDRALPHLQHALALAGSMGSLNYRKDGHYQLARAYKALHRPFEALLHYEAYVALKDTLLNEERTRATAAWQERFNAADRERVILAQDLREERNQQALRKRELQLIGSVGVLLIITLALLFLWRERSRAKRLNTARLKSLEQERTIAVLGAMVEGEERERQRVATELHDGIGVMLGAARLQLDGAGGATEHASRLIAEAASEMRRVSHALMPGSLSKLGLVEALKELADGVNRAQGMRVVLHTHGMRERLPSSVEAGLYRIAQEAMHNALKHAAARNCTLDLSREENGGRVVLVIADDGVGFAPHEGTAPEHGLMNIHMRTRLLNGVCELGSAPGKGTSWTIDIPLQPNGA